MAEKRMFTMKIVDSDAFLDMPMSTQALYFHLNMRADDDGFINNPKKICRYIGCSEDDLKLLIAKRFVLTFETGVIVIKHWRMHNLLRKDRYNPTQYEEELASLELKKNGAYTEKDPDAKYEMLPTVCQVVAKRLPDGCQVVDEMAPQVSIGKVSIGKDSVVYSLGNENITQTDYNTLISQFGKAAVDQTIKRIVDTPYYGCLNVEKISAWCKELKTRSTKKQVLKHGFEGREYDYSKLEIEPDLN